MTKALKENFPTFFYEKNVMAFSSVSSKNYQNCYVIYYIYIVNIIVIRLALYERGIWLGCDRASRPVGSW